MSATYRCPGCRALVSNSKTKRYDRQRLEEIHKPTCSVLRGRAS